ncbi:response regulator [Flavobacterium sp. SM15]|uniref:response regulator n=1 Tax=Flavobacterium sp. SM15 TaxID=2908005 RepID=UPI001EDBCBD5|nr:response regulator [Flavobacterium sp. SM15]MCG2610125.1 response regulator [Flavobacterium sp. SM15]
MKPDCVFLLIEDNLIDQLITTKLLKKALGVVKISVVNNGKEGIEWLRNYKNGLNESLIILLDIKMPEMDGFEFLERFDEISEDVKQNIEIFMLSSTMDRNDIKRAKDNTYVKNLFSKPLPAKEFKDMIQVEHC